MICIMSVASFSIIFCRCNNKDIMIINAQIFVLYVFTWDMR